MDDSFAFRNTVPLRRRFDPRVVKSVFRGMLLVLAVGLFARWVVASERESFSRAEPRVGPSAISVAGLDEAADPSVTDAEAADATQVALTAARAAFLEHGTFLEAGTAELNALEPSYIFVDGPSTTPEIVSVAATADTWAAAVQGPGGTCFWVRATKAGDVTHGIGSDCTGSGALIPPPPR